MNVYCFRKYNYSTRSVVYESTYSCTRSQSTCRASLDKVVTCSGSTKVLRRYFRTFVGTARVFPYSQNYLSLFKRIRTVDSWDRIRPTLILVVQVKQVGQSTSGSMNTFARQYVATYVRTLRYCDIASTFGSYEGLIEYLRRYRRYLRTFESTQYVRRYYVGYVPSKVHSYIQYRTKVQYVVFCFSEQISRAARHGDLK